MNDENSLKGSTLPQPFSWPDRSPSATSLSPMFSSLVDIGVTPCGPGWDPLLWVRTNGRLYRRSRAITRLGYQKNLCVFGRIVNQLSTAYASGTNDHYSVRSKRQPMKWRVVPIPDLTYISSFEAHDGKRWILALSHACYWSPIMPLARPYGFAAPAGQPVPEDLSAKEVTTSIDKSISISDKSISILHLSKRASTRLCRNGISTIGQLLMKTEQDLLGMPGVGKTCVMEIHERLTSFGLALANQPSRSRKANRSSHEQD